MPTFNIPEIPPQLTDSYWSKRELLARKLKTGVSDAITDLKQAYKKAPWKDFTTIFSVQIPDKLGTFAECKTTGKMVAALESQLKDLMKDVQSGAIHKLKLAAWSLRDTAAEVAASLVKEKKYPKAAKLAADIARAADLYAVSVNASSIGGYAKDAYNEILDPLNKKIRTVINATSITGSSAAVLQQLKVIRAEDDAAARAKLVTSTILGGSAKYTMRALNQNIGARMKAAYCGCDYAGLSKAEKLFPVISKWAGSPPAVTAANVDASMLEIEKMAKVAGTLPDAVTFLNR